MTTLAAEPRDAAAWSARPYTDADRQAVLDLFTEPDFYFRTTDPETRSEAQVLDLIDEDVRVLLCDGEVVGLYAAGHAGAEHGCHLELDLRLSAALPAGAWPAAFAAVAAGLRWAAEVVRLEVIVPEFDERGLAFARGCGLREEGTLTDVLVHDGRRAGKVYFSQIQEPTA
jgi:hypothetical protein